MSAEYWADRDKDKKDKVFRAEAEDTATTVSVQFEEQRLTELLRTKTELTGIEPGVFTNKRADAPPSQLKCDCALVKQLFPGVEVTKAWVQPIAQAVKSQKATKEATAFHIRWKKLGRKVTCVTKGVAPIRACAAANARLCGDQGKVIIGWVAGERERSTRDSQAAFGGVAQVTARQAELKKTPTIDSALRQMGPGSANFVLETEMTEKDRHRKEWEEQVQKMPGKTLSEKADRAHQIEHTAKLAASNLKKRLERRAAPPKQAKQEERGKDSERTLHVIQHNAQGLHDAARAELQKRLQVLKPHVVALQETHWKKGQMTPRFAGYAVHRRDAAADTQGRGHGGVALLVAEGVRWQPLPSDALPRSDLVQAVGITIYPGGGARPEVILSVYVPPATRKAFTTAWIPRKAHLFGDFNMHSRKWDTGCKDSTVKSDVIVVERLMQWAQSSGSRLLNDGRTTWTGVGEDGELRHTTPDLTIVGAGIREAKWEDLHELGSDHQAISTRMQVGGPVREKSERRPKWAVDKANWAAFTEQLEKEVSQEEGDVETMSERLTEAVIRAARCHIPLGSRTGKPAWFWWCPEAEEAVKKRKAARKKAEKTGRKADIQNWQREKRRCRQTIQKVKAEAWRTFCDDLDPRARNNGRRAWAVVGALSNKESNLRAMPVIREPGEKAGAPEKVLTDDAAKAEAFAAGVGSESSAFHEMEEGCPQGTISGPVAWDIFVDDAVAAVAAAGGEVSLYADDIAICISGKYVTELYRRGQIAMDGLHKWAQENGVQVSLKKTTTTLLSPEGAAPTRERQLKYGGQPVKQTSAVRLLGLWIDTDWSFSTHIGQVAEKMERRLRLLRRVSGASWGPKRGALRTMYLALVQSIADYALPAYAPYVHPDALKSIRHVEKEAAMLVGGTIG
eukprot:gene20406-36800_t